MGALNAGRVGKILIIDQYLVHRVLSMVRPPSIIHTAAPGRGKLVTLIASSNRRQHMLFMGDRH